MKKYIGFLVVLSVLVLGIPQAKALTLSDLQKQIKSLTEQVSSLKSQLTGSALGAVSNVNSDTTTTLTKPIPNPAISNCTSTTAPWIKVLSPNGGETYTAGQQVTVTWKSCNIPSGAQGGISLSYSGPWTANWSISSMITSNSGSATWPLPPASQFVPGAFQYGNFYRFTVRMFNYANDSSDNQFTINNPGGGVINTTTTTKPTSTSTVSIPASSISSSSITSNQTVIPVSNGSSFQFNPTLPTTNPPNANSPTQMFSATGRLANYSTWYKIFDRTNDMSTDDRVLQANVACPAGKVLLSGGYALPGTTSQRQNMNLFEDDPGTSPNTYEVGVFDPDHAVSNLILYIACADIQP